MQLGTYWEKQFFSSNRLFWKQGIVWQTGVANAIHCFCFLFSEISWQQLRFAMPLSQVPPGITKDYMQFWGEVCAKQVGVTCPFPVQPIPPKYRAPRYTHEASRGNQSSPANFSIAAIAMTSSQSHAVTHLAWARTVTPSGTSHSSELSEFCFHSQSQKQNQN